MIKINLSPVRSNESLTVSVYGSIINVNGTDFDLSVIPDGATVNHAVIRDCTRTGNDYELTLILPHSKNAPYERRFPEPIIMSEDGEVMLPPNYYGGNNEFLA